VPPLLLPGMVPLVLWLLQLELVLALFLHWMSCWAPPNMGLNTGSSSGPAGNSKTNFGSDAVGESGFGVASAGNVGSVNGSVEVGAGFGIYGAPGATALKGESAPSFTNTVTAVFHLLSPRPDRFSTAAAFPVAPGFP
jgi:hypothetical protein